jgi:hypothetical protein
MHRIVFDGMNLHLPDHADLRRDQVLREFGSKCRCLGIREAWRNWDPTLSPDEQKRNLPTALRTVFLDWREGRCRARCVARESCEEHPSVHERGRIVWAVKRSLVACGIGWHTPVSYRVPFAVDIEDHPDVSGFWCTCPYEEKWYLRHGAPNRLLQVAVKPDWLRKVYQRKLDVIDGRFVLDVVTGPEVRIREVCNPRRRGRGKWWGHRCLNPARGPFVLVIDGQCEKHPRPARLVQRLGKDGQPCRALDYDL